MLAQTAAALIAYSKEQTFNKIVYLMNVENTKFETSLSKYKNFSNVKALRSRGRVWKFNGVSMNTNKDIICEATWSAMIMDRDND